jgi:hypothetical protein
MSVAALLPIASLDYGSTVDLAWLRRNDAEGGRRRTRILRGCQRHRLPFAVRRLLTAVRRNIADSGHQLFIVKSNDGIVVRLSLVDRLLENSEPFEVVIYGLPQESIKEPHVAVGKLLDWSPYTRECYERILQSGGRPANKDCFLEYGNPQGHESIAQTHLRLWERTC